MTTDELDLTAEGLGYDSGALHDLPTESEYDEDQQADDCERCGHENTAHTRRGCLIINCPCRD